MSSVHSVQPGDTMVSIAHRYGFREWRTIYEHPENAELRSKRTDPDVLDPGDKVYIPDKKPRIEVCATEARHKFRLKALKAKFRVALVNEFGVPYAGKKYKLEIEGATVEGKLPGDGKLERDVEPTTTKAKLTLWPNDDAPDEVLTWEVKLGHLDSTDRVSGVRGRLNNLGFPCKPDGDELDDTMVEALKAFQASVGLPPSGAIDDATIAQLEARHGS
jgi:N-acetylmuramoyl-L-alanine amidase